MKKVGTHKKKIIRIPNLRLPKNPAISCINNCSCLIPIRYNFTVQLF